MIFSYFHLNHNKMLNVLNVKKDSPYMVINVWDVQAIVKIVMKMMKKHSVIIVVHLINNLYFLI